MIENHLPQNWRELQERVNQIFIDIGLQSEIGKKLTTPRGNVEIDVFAIDTRSIDKTSYIVECKNWDSTIPQTVVHAFTTVMHETGGNIGYIISKKGLQTGAAKYTNNTNIQGLTFLEFQQKYFCHWFDSYFVPNIVSRSKLLYEYTDDFYFFSEFVNFSQYKKKKLKGLREKYYMFAVSVHQLKTTNELQLDGKKAPETVEEFRTTFFSYCNELEIKSEYFRDLLSELIIKIDKATIEFQNI